MICQISNYYSFILELDGAFPIAISEFLGNECNIIYRKNHECPNAITLSENNKAYYEVKDLNEIHFLSVKKLVEKELTNYVDRERAFNKEFVIEDNVLSRLSQKRVNIINEFTEILKKQESFTTNTDYIYLHQISSNIDINCIFGKCKGEVKRKNYYGDDVLLNQYYNQDCIIDSIDGKEINKLYRIAEFKGAELGKQFSAIQWQKIAYTSKVRIEKYGIIFLVYIESDSEKRNKLFDVICDSPNGNTSFVERFSLVKTTLLGTDKLSVYIDKEQKLYTFRDSNTEEVISILGTEDRLSSDEIYALFQYRNSKNRTNIKWMKFCGREDYEVLETLAGFENSRFNNVEDDNIWSSIIDICKSSQSSVIVGAIVNDYYPGRILKIRNQKVDSRIQDYDDIKEYFDKSLPLSSLSLSYTYSPNNGLTIVNLGEGFDPASEEKQFISEYLSSSKFIDNNKWITEKGEIIFARFLSESYNKRTSKYSSAIFILSTNQTIVEDVYKYREKLFEYIMNVNLTNQLRLEDQRARNAINSAIAAIMSRNMSHNLGSHFLHYTKMDLQRSPTDSYACIRGASHSFGFIQDRMNYLAAIVDADKYPNMSVNYYLSIYKPLCVDEFQVDEKNPPTNYYLSNLVRSEGYSKSDGTLTISHTNNDTYLKNLQLSFPGGTVSAHAFYNILENFIRNSAKYQWITEKPDRIKFSISIEQEEDYAIFTIWDNKGNALKKNGEISLVDYMNLRLAGMNILGKDGEIDRQNKGLKEMFISALWLQINLTPKTLGDILYEFDGLPDINEKAKLIFGYGIQYVSSEEQCLGFRFRVPIHHSVAIFDNHKDQYGPHADVLILPGNYLHLDNYTRVIRRVPTKEELNDFKPNVKECWLDDNGKDLKQDFLNVFYLHQSMKSNGIDSNKYYLHIIPDERNEYREDDIDNGKKILYTHHLSTSANITPEDIRHYYYNDVYADSISGKNYTKLLCDQYISSLVSYDYTHIPHKWKDMYRMLLIKESALTKITIIDERLFDGIERWLDINTFAGFIERSQLELDLRNIRVLNYFESDTDMKERVSVAYKEKILKKTGVIWSENEAFELPFYGNEYRKVLGENSNTSCHFLSIHLGIIEKILNNSKILENDKLCGPKGDNALSKERVFRFMKLLKEAFSPKYMCIHSGRGNLNKEMKEILDKYTLVPFSSLQAMFYDSKFMLSQLFYNIKY